MSSITVRRRDFCSLAIHSLSFCYLYMNQRTTEQQMFPKMLWLKCSNLGQKKKRKKKRRKKIKPQNPSLLVTDHKTHQQSFCFTGLFHFWFIGLWEAGREPEEAGCNPWLSWVTLTTPVSNMAGHRESSKFLESGKDCFLTLGIHKTTGWDVLLDQLLVS